jgi:hypothetical protein
MEAARDEALQLRRTVEQHIAATRKAERGAAPAALAPFTARDAQTPAT